MILPVWWSSEAAEVEIHKLRFENEALSIAAEEWERRALAAEAEVARLRGENQ